MGHIKCGLCGSATGLFLFSGRDRDWGSGEEFRLVKCGVCGLVRVDPRPAPEEMHKYYPEENWSRAKTRVREEEAEISGAPWYVAMEERTAPITALSGGGRVLDVGAGDGFLLLFLKRKGWVCYGIEPGPVAAEYARTVLGLSVKTGRLEDSDYPDSFFDVVNFHHVFEHLCSPAGALREVRRILKPGGSVIISVPNFASVDSKIFGSRWVGLKLPQHLFHYETATLRAMLEKAGFEVTSVSYKSYEARSVMYYSESLRYVLQDLGLYPRKTPPGQEVLRSEMTPARLKDCFHAVERFFFKSIGRLSDFFAAGSSLTITSKKPETGGAGGEE